MSKSTSTEGRRVMKIRKNQKSNLKMNRTKTPDKASRIKSQSNRIFDY